MATAPAEGKQAPEFMMETLSGPKRLKDYRGRWLVLYFYPKDDTPGCTREALDFTALAADFEAAGASILGVSRDPLPKHEQFATKHGLGVDLGSDEAGAVSGAYGTWEQKSMYGRSYMGMARRTFLIAPDGRIARIWPKVKVAGHAEEVLGEILGHPNA
jgi:peroxiredoxin Q/BCP